MRFFDYAYFTLLKSMVSDFIVFAFSILSFYSDSYDSNKPYGMILNTLFRFIMSNYS